MLSYKASFELKNRAKFMLQNKSKSKLKDINLKVNVTQTKKNI